MVNGIAGAKATVGFFSSAGPRKANEDFAGAVFGAELPQPRRDVVAVISDGIGGAKGGRVAAETAVRGFLDGFCDLPETMPVQRAAAKIANSLNGWIHTQGRIDPKLAGMGCTFTALVLRGRYAHILHVGDSRAYQLKGDRLLCLTTDHTRTEGGNTARVLYRALGVEAEVRLDYVAQPVSLHDRFLLCSDGVHGFLQDQSIADILRGRSAPNDAARALVAAALRAGSTDNCTALVLDVVQLPMKESAEIGGTILELPLISVPAVGQTIDGFSLQALVSEGRFSRLFAAADEVEGGDVVLKFPKPQAAQAAVYRAAFMREAWVAELTNSPWLGRIVELPPGRQTALYTVMPLYQGERLEERLLRHPAVGLEEGRDIAVKLARAAAALHGAGVIHRDIKPDNVILEPHGALRLIDFGVVRIPGLEDAPPEEFPGTPAYVAPEMYLGEAGNAATDIYALGVTLFRAFTGEFPYGNSGAESPPQRTRPMELCLLRPDLPAWLQAALGRAIARDPTERCRDMMEFAVEMEAGPARAPLLVRRPRTLYERAPLRVWQSIAALLAFALILSLARR